MVLGSHLSVAKGYPQAAQTAVSIGANTFQFFTRNPRGGRARALREGEVDQLRNLMEAHDFGPILAHAPYTLNLAATVEKTALFARNTLREDLERVESLPCSLYNLHPGSHVGEGTDAGISRITEIFNEIVTGRETTTILLETMSGKGSEVGATFGELRRIIDGVAHPERFGVCLDTCHVYDSGYDIKNDLDGVLDELDREVGLKRLKAIHLNDSVYGLGSRKDRHAGIGEGTLGLEAMVNIMRHPALKDLPFFLETPYDDLGHGREISLIREALGHG